ncbi:Uncharacterized protein dnm_029210 [Desulfonema magnum]|uniref:Uncharacterized protein n=1 Tax=Desulfonema magnum TaxID=45655 RepID=A0A975BK11_9BACT|nr:Uncharacterized protein dnm_029210 [Desulfonema magnum]
MILKTGIMMLKMLMRIQIRIVRMVSKLIVRTVVIKNRVHGNTSF